MIINVHTDLDCECMQPKAFATAPSMVYAWCGTVCRRGIVTVISIALYLSCAGYFLLWTPLIIQESSFFCYI